MKLSILTFTLALSLSTQLARASVRVDSGLSIGVGDVKMQLVSSAIYTLKDLGKAYVVEPKFTFDSDFGYGKELLPSAHYSNDIYQYICTKFGFKKGWYNVDGVRSNTNAYSVGKSNGDMRLEVTQEPTIPLRVICNL